VDGGAEICCAAAIAAMKMKHRITLPILTPSPDAEWDGMLG